MSIFSKNLKSYRLRRGMTQAGLAGEINVSQNAIYNWENGKREPSLETINKLAKVLEIDPVDFFMYDDTFMAGFDFTSLNEDEIKAVLHSHTTNSTAIQSDDADFSRINDKKISVNTSIDTTHPFYLLQKKIYNGEQLTAEETSLLISYAEECVTSTLNSIKRIGDKFKIYYRLLNADGQKKADEQLDRALEQIEMLTKIPEYQRQDENEV